MTVPQAAAKWSTRQARLLQQTYRKGWETGQANYRAQYATPPATATATAKGAPSVGTMTRVLAPALQSLARMTAQIAALTTAAAVRAFLAKSAFLLALGVYVLWAAEQAGYAEAASADGLLLEWQLDPRADHCEDCPALAKLPAMPLDQWPTLPGEGATACRQGCKCSLHAVPATEQKPLTVDEQDVLARVGARQPVLVAA